MGSISSYLNQSNNTYYYKNTGCASGVQQNSVACGAYNGSGVAGGSGVNGASGASGASGGSVIEIDVTVERLSINQVIELFVSGNLTWGEFQKWANSQRAVTSVIKQTNGETDTIKFKCYNKQYTISCNKKAATSQLDNKTVDVRTKSELMSYGFTADEITTYFNQVSNYGEEKYALKENCGHKYIYTLVSEINEKHQKSYEEVQNKLVMQNFLNGKQTYTYANGKVIENSKALRQTSDGDFLSSSNYKKYADEISQATGGDVEKLKQEALDKFIKDFSNGDVAFNQAYTILNAIGVENYKTQIANGKYELNFDFGGKHYSISCVKEAAASGVDNVKATTSNAANILDNPPENLYATKDVLKKLGFSDSEISKYFVQQDFKSGSETKTALFIKSGVTVKGKMVATVPQLFVALQKTDIFAESIQKAIETAYQEGITMAENMYKINKQAMLGAKMSVHNIAGDPSSKEISEAINKFIEGYTINIENLESDLVAYFSVYKNVKEAVESDMVNAKARTSESESVLENPPEKSYCTKDFLKKLGFSDSDINKYFTEREYINGSQKGTAMFLNSGVTINGKEITSVSDLVIAMNKTEYFSDIADKAIEQMYESANKKAEKAHGHLKGAAYALAKSFYNSLIKAKEGLGEFIQNYSGNIEEIPDKIKEFLLTTCSMAKYFAWLMNKE